MTSRLVILLLCGGALALACGPRSRSTAATAGTDTGSTSAAGTPAQAGRQLATSLNVSVGAGVTLVLHVTNTSGKQLELTFPSGQTHDFVVLDSVGKEVWRWSADRMFTQALQSKLLDSRETVTFEERWNPRGLTGSFSAVATLKSSQYPLEERVSFTLP